MKRYRLVPQTPVPTGGDSELLSELNPAQREAAELIDGPALVIAGAGTGKTRTLIYRTAHLVEKGVAPESILLLTFTRRAAEEMLRRAGGLLDTRCDRVSGGTFHATAVGLLRRYGSAVGLERDFTILDRADAEEVMGLVRAELRLGESGKHFPKHFPKKRTMLDMVSKTVNRDVPLAETVAREFPHFEQFTDDLTAAAARYRVEKRRRQLVDYDDLLTLLVELLEEHPDEAARIASLYRHIMVDEYQDTNRIQARLVRGLARGHDNVMAVGDDAQSIYAFRGACFRNIMDFPQEFPGARIIKLTENYRSTPQVLAVANRVIAGASERYDKELTPHQPDGEPPALICAATEHMQSRFICQRIVELTEEGIDLPEIAVLFRSAFHSFDLEVELARAGLPYVKRGGIKFMEAAHVKDLVAYLRVLANPKDAISWGRILKLQPGVGEVTARRIFEQIAAADDPWDGLAALPAPWGPKLAGLRALLVPLAKSALPPAELAEQVCSYYREQLVAHYDDHPKRARDLDQFIVLAERYQKLPPFLTDLALEPPEASMAGVDRKEKHEVLTLSTIHSAKGLEWRAVFVIWAVDGRFPSAYAEGSEEELDEERRLMYVALTRAKEHLAITYPVGVYDRASGMILSRPSRFVDGLPAEELTPFALAEDGAQKPPARLSQRFAAMSGHGESSGPEAGPGMEDYFSQEHGW